MTLEQATEALYGFRDHLVDVTIALTGEVGGEQSLASFSGTPVEVRHVDRPGEEHWTLVWPRKRGDPDASSVTIWRNGFEGGEINEPEELTVRHRGVTIRLFAYM